MEFLILIVSLLFVLVGIAGSLLPALPGPPLSWIGLLILYTTPAIAFDYWILGITFVLTLIIVILDYMTIRYLYLLFYCLIFGRESKINSYEFA